VFSGDKFDMQFVKMENWLDVGYGLVNIVDILDRSSERLYISYLIIG
jgi:hypothetical protein